MKTRFIPRIFISFGLLASIILALCAVNAPAQTSISLNLNYNTFPAANSYYIQVPISTANTILTSYEVDSPHTNFQSTFDPTNGQVNSTFTNITRFDDLMAEVTNGNWKFITDVGSPSQQTYFFHVSATGFNSNNMPPFQITNPASEQANVSPSATFTWTGGPSDYSSLNVDVVNPDGSFFEFDSFSPETSGSWTPNNPLSGDDTNFFFEVNYETSATNFLTISTPMTTGGQALPGWSSASTLTLVEFVHFTTGVPITNSPGHSLVAHYTFDDTNNPGVDSSGNGLGFNAGSGQNGGSVQGVSDAKIGAGALQFSRNDTDPFSCGAQGWFPTTPSQILSTLAGSFSVSVWVKTSSSIGNADDAGYNGSAVLGADVGGQANDTVPISLTAGLVAFTTGGTEDDTLHSSTTVNNGTYHHIVVTRDQTAGNKVIYIDGQLNATGSGTTALLSDPKTVVIGAVTDSSNPTFGEAVFSAGFDGEMDDMQIYSGVLNATEVSNLFTNPGTTASNVVPFGLVAHYAFDNTNNIGQDTSGNGFHLDYNGDPEGDGVFARTNSKAGGHAAFFDGGSFLSYTSTPSSVLAAFASDFTLSFWIKTTNSSGNDGDPAFEDAGIVAADIPGQHNDIIPAALTGGGIGFNTGSSDESTINSTSDINDGHYHQVAITRDQATGARQIYIDGALNNSDTSTTALLNDPLNIAVGCQIDASQSDPDFASPQNFFRGFLDDMQIYSRVLSTNEISFLFQNPGMVVGTAAVPKPPVSVSISLSLNRQQNPDFGDIFLVFPSVNVSQPAVITTNTLSSPTGQFNSSQTADGGGGGGSTIFSSLNDILNECTNGLWTLVVNQGDPSEQVFHFSVAISGLTSNVLVSVPIFSPATGAIVSPTPAFQWSGPANYQVLTVSKQNDDGSDNASTNLPVTATNWLTAPALDPGTNDFTVDYLSNNFPGVTFSTPVDASMNPVSNLVTTAMLHSGAFTRFTVTTGPVPVQLTSVTTTNGNFQFSFISTAGHTNIVQSRTNLASGTWLLFTNIVGDGNMKNIVVPANSPAQRFFRVDTQ